MVACLIATSIGALIITADGDTASPPGLMSSECAVKCTPHRVYPSKESNMKANVYDEGRVPAVPPLPKVGKPLSRKPIAAAKAGSAVWLMTALLVLSAIPLGAGAFRITEQAGGAAITPANAR
jgi:hypothetical protein